MYDETSCIQYCDGVRLIHDCGIDNSCGSQTSIARRSMVKCTDRTAYTTVLYIKYESVKDSRRLRLLFKYYCFRSLSINHVTFTIQAIYELLDTVVV